MDVALLALAFLLGIPLLTALMGWFGERPVKPYEPRPVNRDSTRKATVITLALILALTVIGEYFALTIGYYPTVMSDKGDEIHSAFRTLTVFAVPVAAMVLAVLVYTYLARGRGSPTDELAEDYDGHGVFPKAWLGVTAGLTLLVMIYPGMTSLPGVIKRDRNPEVLVNVKGVQWSWVVTYPDLNAGPVPELVMPVGSRVRFDITSGDVLHAFWVPAFLVRIDAIPGTTTSISMRATKEGSYDSIQDLRLQCSQLCGVSHSSMRMPVRVVSQDEFDKWIRDHKSKTALSGESY